MVVPRMATSVAHAPLAAGRLGLNVSRATSDQSGPRYRAVTTYAARVSASHLSPAASTEERSRIVATAMPTPSTTTQTGELTPVSSSAASAMPVRSAPTLIVF